MIFAWVVLFFVAPQEFVMAKIALDEQWRCALAEAVVAGKEAGREEVNFILTVAHIGPIVDPHFMI